MNRLAMCNINLNVLLANVVKMQQHATSITIANIIAVFREIRSVMNNSDGTITTPSMNQLRIGSRSVEQIPCFIPTSLFVLRKYNRVPIPPIKLKYEPARRLNVE
tara:strand:- start:160 stop:474 length:315 start_codon:yes stop_codon:yes gene_type:complete